VLERLLQAGRQCRKEASEVGQVQAAVTVTSFLCFLSARLIDSQ
jgi:hypothetical protein